MGISAGKIKPINYHDEQQTTNLIRQNYKNSDFDKYLNLVFLYKDNLENLINSFKCYICMTSYVELIPTCGHVGICNKCYNNRYFYYRNNCSICKKDIRYNPIILPFSKEEVKCDHINLFKLFEKDEIKKVKCKNNRQKINQLQTQENEYEREMIKNNEFEVKYLEISNNNNILEKKYKKLLDLNRLLKNKINLQSKKNRNLRIKAINSYKFSIKMGKKYNDI